MTVYIWFWCPHEDINQPLIREILATSIISGQRHIPGIPLKRHQVKYKNGLNFWEVYACIFRSEGTGTYVTCLVSKQLHIEWWSNLNIYVRQDSLIKMQTERKSTEKSTQLFPVMFLND